MKTTLAWAILILSIISFKWWGLLSLIIVFPLMGWDDRHKGPFLMEREGTTDWSKAESLLSKYPRSGKLLQDYIVEIDKNIISKKEEHQNKLTQLLHSLNEEEYEIESSEKEEIIGFLNQFSDAFPNWKDVYRVVFNQIKDSKF